MDNRSKKLWRSGLSIVVLIAIMVAIEVKAPGTMKRVIVDDVEVTIRSLVSHHPAVSKKVAASPRQLSEGEKYSLALDIEFLTSPQKDVEGLMFKKATSPVKSLLSGNAATVVAAQTNWSGITTVVFTLPREDYQYFISGDKQCFRQVKRGDMVVFKAVVPRPIPEDDDLGNWLEVTVVKPAQSPTMRAIEIQNKRWAQEKRH